MFWIASAILAAAGMLFQFKPWKEADYWEDDDEEEREHRAKARARRKRRSRFHPLPSRKKKKDAAAPLPLLPATQEIRTAAIRNRRTVPVFRRTPCTISVLFRKNLTMTTMRKIFRNHPPPANPQTGRSGEFDEEETSPKASMGDTKPYTSPSKPQITDGRHPGCRSLRDPGSRFPKRYREFTKTIRTRNPHCSAENPAGKGTFPCLPGSFLS